MLLLSTGSPLNFQNTKSHVNCSESSLSAGAYKGILYLENLGGDQLKEAPCINTLGLLFTLFQQSQVGFLCCSGFLCGPQSEDWGLDCV